jgi:predicted nucleotidyltransferase component of viral defense system
MKNEIKNISASIHDRLRNYANDTGRTYNDLFYIFANERFLYRLSKSAHAKKFVLKGAMAVLNLQIDQPRYTRDIDLLGFTDNSIVNIEQILRDICFVEVEDDGLFFDPDSIVSSSIKLHDNYPGVRVKIDVSLFDKGATKLQIDIGFGDDVYPEPEFGKFGGMLNLPEAIIRMYPIEAILAEKIHPIVNLGKFNSRMKDIYDLWLIASNKRIDGKTFSKALRLTFENRHTSFPKTLVIFGDNYLDQNILVNWDSIGEKLQSKEHLPELPYVLKQLQAFLIPIMESLYQGKEFSLIWDPSKDWGWQ